MEKLHLHPRTHISGQVHLPGSKSISNRTLLLAALSSGQTQIIDLLDSDDVRYMIQALKALGIDIQANDQGWLLQGCGGTFPQASADLFLGNAGTAFRPLTAALALMPGQYHLHGVERMHERPIKDLVDALRPIGANIEYLKQEGYPPLQTQIPTLDLSQPVKIKGNVSSQFLTALLMSLPLTKQAVHIQVEGELISKPYIEITLNLMRQFGVQVTQDGWSDFYIAENSSYVAPAQIHVEGDASSASYFLAAGLLAGGPVRVLGVGKNSIQGDIKFAQALEQMGAKITMGDNWIEASLQEQGILPLDMDLNHIPDAAMTLAIVALKASGTSILRNIASWRVKETDRISAMATELRKLGATIEEGADYLKITPPLSITPNVEIHTYDDHRMAMCFSLVSLLNTPITILDPNCVAKTFPRYFEVFQAL